MSSLAIIPARGGSKRIPRKNIKPFLGKPIIAYSIDAALETGMFSEVMVSTDDGEIAAIAKQYGAKVPFFRSAKNADDFATTFDVINEVVSAYQNNGFNFQTICCIYPCAPFVNKGILTKAYHEFENKKADSCFPIIKYGSPIQRALKINEHHIVSAFNPASIQERSQDLQPAYFDAGQFYWLRTNEVLAQKKILTDNTVSIVLEEHEAQDIDNEIDWQIAEMKYTILNK